jgi:hypothetical protein
MALRAARKLVGVAAGSLVVLLAPVVARAQQAAPDPAAAHEHPSLLDRPHTVAEFEAGIIALPGAPISPSNQGGATPLGRVGNGDATVQTGLHLIYRATRDWAVGAGALFAPRPTSDTNYGGASGLPRTHSRSYLFLGGEARYFPFRSRVIEAWLGVTTGAVIIGDRFSTDSAPAVPAILGTRVVTSSTEGFAIGGQIGADYLITDQWVLGLTVRGDGWFLPSEKPFSQQSSCDPIGDCPTLGGTVAAFEVGLGVGYRIPL